MNLSEIREHFISKKSKNPTFLYTKKYHSEVVKYVFSLFFWTYGILNLGIVQ